MATLVIVIRSRRCLLTPLVAAVLMQACSGDGSGPRPVASVQVNPGIDTLIMISQTRQLSATAKDAGGSVIHDVSFVWTSSNDAVATVSPSGLVTAVGAGEARIAAAASQIVGNADVVVQPVAQLAFITQPGNVEGQVPFDPIIRVAIQDSSGTTVTRAALDVTVALAVNPGGAKLVGGTIVRAVGGVATFTNLGVDRPGEGFVLEAHATGLRPDSTTTFAVHLTFAVASAASGGAHSCGLTVAGFAYCWGENGDAELGDSSFTNRRTPTPVAGRRTFLRLSPGRDHTCALATTNEAYCWGANGQGQLGDGGAANPGLVPTRVSGGLPFDQISAGILHTCGVTAAGVAYCWGRNSFGQLGDGVGTQRYTPTAVAGALRFLQVSAGDNHSCGITVDSLAYCWGDNFYGQLGDSTHDMRLAPTPVRSALRFGQISAGITHTCAVTGDNGAYCWGSGGNGVLGDGTGEQRLTPTPVAGSIAFAAIAAAPAHSCAVTPGGEAYCWGTNFQGELGSGDAGPSYSPAPVAGNLVFAAITGGGGHTCGATLDHVAYCWGSNLFGQLGDGLPENQIAPSRVRH